MCGIAGFTFEEKSTSFDKDIMAMTEAMSHRGPDADGHWIGDGVALGHKRLSIIDLSDSSAQPMEDYTGRYTLVFNGEIYNFKEIKAKLKDYPFRSEGDTEMILAAYSKWGKDAFNHFNGMFALAIWDKVEEELILVRDRMGIKPIYYYQNGDKLVFASEIRSLLSSGMVPAVLNQEALPEYLQYYSVNSPRTLIKDVRMLKAGEMGIWKKGEWRTKSFWSLAKQGHEVREDSYEQLCKENLQILSEAVERRMISDVPLGAFLSGGIDSSAIVALMAQSSEQAVHTFSIVFDEEEFDESPYSMQIANKYNTAHHPIKLSPSHFLKKLPDALDSMDHPSGDGINSYVVSEATKNEGFTVALSGLGGDELYAGYPVFKQYQKLQSYSPVFAVPAPLRKVGAGLLGNFVGKAKTGRLQQMLESPDSNFESIYPLFREIYSPKERGNILLTKGKPFSFTEVFSPEELISIGRLPIFNQVGIGEMSTYTQNVLLRDTDQMSMAHSLEVRVPFFDHELVSFALSISDKDKEPEYPKKFLVDSLGDLLPKEVVFRKKMGFVFPWIEWLKGPLKELANSKIESLGKRGIFRESELQNYWRGFLQGDSSIYWIKIWLLVVLESWMEKNGIEA
ncbi:MAG: asparagine synthase (glutamine-hydrolyzing) [Bacteroidia bacterium]|nr:asparagine synthase (glutamine-hydrolyzing) [Bacteroidia bacterium]